MVSCDAGMSPTRGQVIINNRIVSYLRWGSGARHVLLLHGVTSSARSWWRVAPGIASLGYCVTAFDMPGHGESNLIGHHDIPHIADHLSAACAALAIPIHTLLGHSWGGATALVMAQSQPLQRLILIDPLIKLDPSGGAQLVAKYGEGVGHSSAETLPWLTARNKLWHRCDVQWKAEALQQCRREAVEGLLLNSGEWDITPLFAQITTNTLCLVADTAATIIPAASIPTIQKALSQHTGRWVQIAGTDHNMYRGGFDVTMPRLIEWIKEDSDDSTSN